MCGRARLSATYAEIRIALGLSDFYPAPNLRPSWNITPTQDMLCIVLDKASRRRKPVKMRWGLIPSWAKTSKLAYPTFNARADTIRTKPTFRGAWQAGQRCLAITGGYYEWRKSDKQPFALACDGSNLTVMAGLWDEWRGPDGEIILSCTIITTEARDASVHDRMPVILAEEDWPAWLGETPATEQDLFALLRPYPADKMKVWPVGARIGNVRNDDASLLTEAAQTPNPPDLFQ